MIIKTTLKPMTIDTETAPMAFDFVKSENGNVDRAFLTLGSDNAQTHFPIADLCDLYISPDEVEELGQEIAQRWNEYQQALNYAKMLVLSIHKKHYQQNNPDWKPLDDLVGILTQIDNQCAGLERK